MYMGGLVTPKKCVSVTRIIDYISLIRNHLFMTWKSESRGVYEYDVLTLYEIRTLKGAVLRLFFCL